MSERILCVDDDVNILGAFQRQLRKEFQIVGALGGEKALKTLIDNGPFAVVVSDLQMPGMNGLEFLSKVKDISPESVRIIFSGRADLNTAIAAVNEGNIFRFLTKPCPPDALSRTLSQALDHHRLVVAERELLEKTLRGSVKVLVDILALLNPPVFSRSNRIQACTLHIATVLNALRWKWQLELAAMLSQIGCITLSETIVSKSLASEALSAEEQAEFEAHPMTGARLIANIPRLELVAQIISLQQQRYEHFKQNRAGGKELAPQEVLEFGAQALRVSIEFDKLRSRSIGAANALEILRAKKGEYNPEMLAALATFESSGGPMQRMQVGIRELTPGMITISNVYSADGTLLLARDLEVSDAVVEVLRKYEQTRGVRGPIDVLAPIGTKLEK